MVLDDDSTPEKIDSVRADVVRFYRKPALSPGERRLVAQAAEQQILAHCRRRRRVRGVHTSDDSSTSSDSYVYDDVSQEDVEITFDEGEPFGLKLKLLMKRRPRVVVICHLKPNSPATNRVGVGDALVAWRVNSVEERFVPAHLNTDFFADFIDRLLLAPRPVTLNFRRGRPPHSDTALQAEITRLHDRAPKQDLDSPTTYCPITGRSARSLAQQEVARIQRQAANMLAPIIDTPPQNHRREEEEEEEEDDDGGPMGHTRSYEMDF
ncbi:hypothetical protein CTAYLR_004742 [Chrysophaeum taylorii]|uniref:Uncharacterized protein n=1 Tax=Chrysophaeum taylorii TaxID=2483200 RepID=A0AAD7U7H1_9STRA|nr:hypothetical protein CTAYLR_004742 [Chrysophaeum taylorii]